MLTHRSRSQTRRNSNRPSAASEDNGNWSDDPDYDSPAYPCNRMNSPYSRVGMDNNTSSGTGRSHNSQSRRNIERGSSWSHAGAGGQAVPYRRPTIEPHLPLPPRYNMPPFDPPQNTAPSPQYDRPSQNNPFMPQTTPYGRPPYHTRPYPNGALYSPPLPPPPPPQADFYGPLPNLRPRELRQKQVRIDTRNQEEKIQRQKRAQDAESREQEERARLRSEKEWTRRQEELAATIGTRIAGEMKNELEKINRRLDSQLPAGDGGMNGLAQLLTQLPLSNGQNGLHDTHIPQRPGWYQALPDPRYDSAVASIADALQRNRLVPAFAHQHSGLPITQHSSNHDGAILDIIRYFMSEHRDLRSMFHELQHDIQTLDGESSTQSGLQSAEPRAGSSIPASRRAVTDPDIASQGTAASRHTTRSAPAGGIDYLAHNPGKRRRDWLQRPEYEEREYDGEVLYPSRPTRQNTTNNRVQRGHPRPDTGRLAVNKTQLGRLPHRRRPSLSGSAPHTVTHSNYMHPYIEEGYESNEDIIGNQDDYEKTDWEQYYDDDDANDNEEDHNDYHQTTYDYDYDNEQYCMGTTPRRRNGRYALNGQSLGPERRLSQRAARERSFSVSRQGSPLPFAPSISS